MATKSERKITTVYMLSHDSTNLFCEGRGEVIDRLRNTPHYFKGEYDSLNLFADGTFKRGIDVTTSEGILDWEGVDWGGLLEGHTEVAVYGHSREFKHIEIWRCVKSEIDSEILEAMIEAMPEFDEF